jgi:hypothetical protein
MATESPLIHDGSQTTAVANYGNSSSYSGSSAGYSGPQGSAQYLAVYISASRVVTLVAAIGAKIYGILQNKPNIGAAADVGVLGPGKCVAGGTIAAGVPLMTDTSGRLIAWTSGSGYAQVGYSIESAVVGQVFTAYIWGSINPIVLT